MGKENLRLGIYSVCHFFVDLSCALLLFGVACPGGDGPVLLLVYNFLAFAVQMPLGALADRAGRPHLFAAGGCLLSALAWLLPGMGAAAVAGAGNALFHVGGGTDTLHRTGGKCGPLGLFVSPGALGIFLGSLWAGRAPSLALPVGGLLLVCAAVIALLCPVSLPGRLSLRCAVPGGGRALVCLFLVVVLRSYLGSVLSFPWKGEYALFLTCALVLGKALGGVLSDRFGLSRTAVLSLLTGAVLFLFPALPAAGMAAVLLFNMTMPMTLWAAARILPGGRGFAFGLCTFALFLGALPALLGFSPPPTQVVAPLCTLISLPLLLWGTRGVSHR